MIEATWLNVNDPGGTLRAIPRSVNVVRWAVPRKGIPC